MICFIILLRLTVTVFVLQDGLLLEDGESAGVVDVDQASSDGLWSPVSASRLGVPLRIVLDSK